MIKTSVPPRTFLVKQPRNVMLEEPKKTVLKMLTVKGKLKVVLEIVIYSEQYVIMLIVLYSLLIFTGCYI